MPLLGTEARQCAVSSPILPYVAAAYSSLDLRPGIGGKTCGHLGDTLDPNMRYEMRVGLIVLSRGDATPLWDDVTDPIVEITLSLFIRCEFPGFTVGDGRTLA